jgi:hypothetical protein
MTHGLLTTLTNQVISSATSAIMITSRHTASERLGSTVCVTSMTDEDYCAQSKAEQNLENARTGGDILRPATLRILTARHRPGWRYISMRNLPLKIIITHYQERRETILVHIQALWERRKQLVNDKKETKLSDFTT